MANEYDIKIYTKSECLPQLLEGNFFHSLELFQISERVPSDTPIMAVAITRQGEVVGQMLAVIHRHRIIFPPFIYTHAHAHGEGAYLDATTADALFPLLLHALTRELNHMHCLYVEFSEIQKKMFGYRYFRRAGYFPIAWQEVYNSLHSKAPSERLTNRARQHIEAGKRRGLECHITRKRDEVGRFYKLYKDFYRLKPRRYVPPREYFEEISQSSEAKVFIATYGKKLLGGCTLAICQQDAYLWHLASKRKSFRLLHPDTMIVWNAISYAYEQGYAHLHFMDVGLPWKRNPFRDFIRSFGGKPVAKFRWFRFNIRLVNAILRWIYKP